MTDARCGHAASRDPRTGHREGRVKDVLDGALDRFLLAYLAQQQGVTGNGATVVTTRSESEDETS